MSYQVPNTFQERISEFNVLVDEFKQELVLLTEKQKKVSGARARKALLSISKLTRVLRKDIAEIVANMSKSNTETVKPVTTAEPVVDSAEPVAQTTQE